VDAPFSAVPHWLQWTLVAAAVLGAIATCIRALPPIWGFVQRLVGLVDALTELVPFLEKNDPILDQLSQQVVNDHGHMNLREQLDRIEDSQKRLEPQVTDTVTRLDRVEMGVAGLYKDQQALSDRFDDAEQTWRKNRGGDATN
jgi:hypothetical protein